MKWKIIEVYPFHIRISSRPLVKERKDQRVSTIAKRRQCNLKLFRSVLTNSLPKQKEREIRFLNTAI